MVKAIDFTKQGILKLINMYKERPSLWKLNHDNYTNKNIKNKEYEEIVEAFREEYPDIDITVIKNKLQNLRSSYRKEIKKVEASERSGTGVDDIYEPTLWYFNFLSFTRDQDRPLHSISNLEDSQNSVAGEEQVPRESEREGEQLQENEEETEQFLTPSGPKKKRTENDLPTFKKTCTTAINTPSASTDDCAPLKIFKPAEPKKKRTKEIEKDLSAFMKTCTTAINTPSTSTDDCAALGTYVAEKLRKMDDTQQILAEALIQKVVTKGLRKQLTDKTDLFETSLTYDQELPTLSTRTTFQQHNETSLIYQQLSTPPIMTVEHPISSFGSSTASSTSSTITDFYNNPDNYSYENN